MTTKHKWNPSIDDIQKKMVLKGKNIKKVGERQSMYQGSKAIITTRETVQSLHDPREYVRLYTDDDSIKVLEKLNKNGIQVFFYILRYSLEVDREYIYFSTSLCMRDTGLSYDVVRRGIRNLLKYKVLYESAFDNQYWVNANIMYKGRIEPKVTEYQEVKR